MKTYRAIRVIQKITGGGGDADDEKNAFKEKMARAKEAGEEVGSLTYEKMKKWMDKGWYQLFADRYGSDLYPTFETHALLTALTIIQRRSVH